MRDQCIVDGYFFLTEMKCNWPVSQAEWIIKRVFHFQSVRGRKKGLHFLLPLRPWCSRQIFKWRLWKFLGCTLDLSCKAGPSEDCCLHPVHLCPAQPIFGSLPSGQTSSNKRHNWDVPGEILGPNVGHSGFQSGELWTLDTPGTDNNRGCLLRHQKDKSSC